MKKIRLSKNDSVIEVSETGTVLLDGVYYDVVIDFLTGKVELINICEDTNYATEHIFTDNIALYDTDKTAHGKSTLVKPYVPSFARNNPWWYMYRGNNACFTCLSRYERTHAKKHIFYENYLDDVNEYVNVMTSIVPNISNMLNFYGNLRLNYTTLYSEIGIDLTNRPAGTNEEDSVVLVVDPYMIYSGWTALDFHEKDFLSKNYKFNKLNFYVKESSVYKHDLKIEINCSDVIINKLFSQIILKLLVDDNLKELFNDIDLEYRTSNKLDVTLDGFDGKIFKYINRFNADVSSFRDSIKAIELLRLSPDLKGFSIEPLNKSEKYATTYNVTHDDNGLAIRTLKCNNADYLKAFNEEDNIFELRILLKHIEGIFKSDSLKHYQEFDSNGSVVLEYYASNISHDKHYDLRNYVSSSYFEEGVVVGNSIISDNYANTGYVVDDYVGLKSDSLSKFIGVKAVEDNYVNSGYFEIVDETIKEPIDDSFVIYNDFFTENEYVYLPAGQLVLDNLQVSMNKADLSKLSDFDIVKNAKSIEVLYSEHYRSCLELEKQNGVKPTVSQIAKKGGTYISVDESVNIVDLKEAIAHGATYIEAENITYQKGVSIKCDYETYLGLSKHVVAPIVTLTKRVTLPAIFNESAKHIVTEKGYYVDWFSSDMKNVETINGSDKTVYETSRVDKKDKHNLGVKPLEAERITGLLKVFGIEDEEYLNNFYLNISSGVPNSENIAMIIRLIRLNLQKAPIKNTPEFLKYDRKMLNETYKDEKSRAFIKTCLSFADSNADKVENAISLSDTAFFNSLVSIEKDVISDILSGEDAERKIYSNPIYRYHEFSSSGTCIISQQNSWNLPAPEDSQVTTELPFKIPFLLTTSLWQASSWTGRDHIETGLSIGKYKYDSKNKKVSTTLPTLTQQKPRSRVIRTNKYTLEFDDSGYKSYKETSTVTYIDESTGGIVVAENNGAGEEIKKVEYTVKKADDGSIKISYDNKTDVDAKFFQINDKKIKAGGII